MKQKSLSQINKEKKTKLKPMTIEEEYRNADVPMPNDLLHASNTEKFKDEDIEAMDNAGIEYTETIKNSQSDEDYKSGGAYKAIIQMFSNQLDDEKFIEHCKKFFKGEKK